MTDIFRFEGPNLFEIEAMTTPYMDKAAVRGQCFADNFHTFIPVPEGLPAYEWVRFTVPAVGKVEIAEMDFNLDLTVIAGVLDLGNGSGVSSHQPTSARLELTHPFLTRREPFHTVLLWSANDRASSSFMAYKQLAELMGIDIFELDKYLEQMVDRSSDSSFWEGGAWTNMTGRILDLRDNDFPVPSYLR